MKIKSKKKYINTRIMNKMAILLFMKKNVRDAMKLCANKTTITKKDLNEKQLNFQNKYQIKSS